MNGIVIKRLHVRKDVRSKQVNQSVTMRCGGHNGDAIGNAESRQIQALLQVRRSVIDTWQNVAVKIDHSLVCPAVERRSVIFAFRLTNEAAEF